MNIRLFFLLVVLSVSSWVSAQIGTVKVPRSSHTIKELVQIIQTQTTYSFAFTNSVLDTSIQVSVTPGDVSVKSLLDLIAASSECTYVIKSRFILIQPASKPEKKEKLLIENKELNEMYVPSDERYIDRVLLDKTHYQLPDSIIYAEQTLYEYPELEWKEPYSVYHDPKVYGTVKQALPRFALRTNLFRWATAGTPNFSVEFGLSSKVTLEVAGSYNPWYGSGDKKHKLEHWVVRPELRYWLKERYTGHSFGVHALYADYDISGYDVPLLFKAKHRYDGTAWGGGLSYGFQLPLSAKWAVELTAGVGVARMTYDKYVFDQILKEHKVYVGPTKAGVNIVYLLK